MKTDICWIRGLPRGRLGIAPRPRGGDWLDAEVKSWRAAGVECVVSGLDSEDDLKLVEDGLKAAAGGRVHRYAFREGVAKFNFESGKTAQELTDAIMASSLKGKIKLANTTPNKIEYTFVK